MMPVTKRAIVYDWADTRHGGAEKVLTALHELYPDAPLYTSFTEKTATWVQQFPAVQTTFIQRLPAFWRHHKKFLAPLLPIAFENIDLSGFNTIISVSSFVSKAVITKPGQLHICYLLTPTRFLYSHQDDYIHHQDRLTSGVSTYLRHWDYQAARRPDKIIAISQLVGQRARKFYEREIDDIIHPTIIDKSIKNQEIDHNLSTSLPPQFFLCVARLTAYKHIDLVVEICGRLGYPLLVIGNGPQLRSIRRLISRRQWSHIHLYQNVTPAFLTACYRQATALLAPGLEDFGINLLEANAAGTIVVTHPQSGARELLNADQAIDLDPENIQASLERAIKRLWQAPKISVTSQNHDINSFKRLWREKVAIYENERF